MAPTENEDRLIDHSYDGIQEYDNPLPRWWVYTFYATIVFSVLYVLNVIPTMGVGEGRIAQYESDVAAWRAQHPAPEGGVSAEALAALATNAGAVTLGSQVFGTYCASCHRPDGGGLIGPNLTDETWIHGGGLASIHRTITDGVMAKGMPAWGKILKKDQLEGVVVYVASLKGTNPPNPKAAEGEPGKQ